MRHSFRASAPVLTFALAAAVAVGACGGSGSPTAGPGATKTAGSATNNPVATVVPGGSAPAVGTAKAACDLLTDAEIESVVGAKVESKDGGRSDVAYQNNCAWLFEGNPWTLVLGIGSPGGAMEYGLMFEYEEGTEIPGLGDKAFKGDVSDSLFALKGDTLINLQFVAVGEADDVEQRLVERVLEKLP